MSDVQTQDVLDKAVAEGGAYEVLHKRLQEQGQRLRGLTEALNGQRLAEFGSCHRNEPSGSLHGIMRVRGFTQDDAHIFCTEEQIQPEVSRFIDFLHAVYADFGFDDVIYRLSTRPAQRVGTDADWDRAEKALADALDAVLPTAVAAARARA